MAMKKRFKQRKTDAIIDGIVYRLVDGEYGVYTYTADIPEKVSVVFEVNSIPVTALLDGCLSDSPITKIELPASLKRIGDGAFRGCKELAEVKVPDGVHTVGGAAFKNCKGLKRLELGRHTKKLGWSLCEGCKSIEDFIIWDEVEYFGSNMFWCGGKKLRYTEYSYGLYLGNPENPYVILDRNVRIDPPEEGEKIIVDIHPKTKFVASSAFNVLCDGGVPIARIDEVIVHDGLLKIDGGSFALTFKIFGREQIQTVRANSLETLCRASGGLLGSAKHLIIDGEEITDLVIPKHIHRIEADTFAYCSWLKSLTFEGDDISIGYNAFSNTGNLTQVTLPRKVAEIGSRAFQNCRSLQHVDFYAVGEISYDAFVGAGLKSIAFHAPVSKVCKDAFAKNAKLESVAGFEYVREAEEAFAGTPFEGKFVTGDTD